MRNQFALFLCIVFLAGCEARMNTGNGVAADPCGDACVEGITACEEHDGDYACLPVDDDNGDGDGDTDPCGGNCGAGTVCVTDADGSGYCDVQDPGNNGNDCGGVCGPGTVCQNGGCVTDGNDGGGNVTPPPAGSGLYNVKFTVYSPGNADRIDFNYGYCSDTENPNQCHAWIEPACMSEDKNYVVCTVQVQELGVLRFNASFYANANGTPNGWLCEGPSNPHLTGAVAIEVVGGPSYDTSAVSKTSFGNGCSAYVLPDALIP